VADLILGALILYLISGLSWLFLTKWESLFLVSLFRPLLEVMDFWVNFFE